MAVLLITSRLPTSALRILEGCGHDIVYRDASSPMERAELLDAARSANGIVASLADRIDEEVFACAPALKVVANVAVGLDNIELAAAARHGVAVCNTPGVLDASTADVTIFLMLAARRRTTEREAEVRDGRWTGWGIAENLALDLSSSTIGLVGYGRIGQAVARRARAFDATVLHHTRHDTGEQGWCGSLLEMAKTVDVLSIHVPFNEESRNLVSAEILAALKPTAVVVNTARGAVLDEEALVDGLESGALFGAGLDVYQGEPRLNPRLLSAPHIVLLPHIGSATEGTRRAMAELALRGALEVLAGHRPANLVAVSS